MLTIFGPIEDSEFVMCCPPVSQQNCGFVGSALRQDLLTVDDLTIFPIGDQEVTMFNFDKVINDTFED